MTYFNTANTRYYYTTAPRDYDYGCTDEIMTGIRSGLRSATAPYRLVAVHSNRGGVFHENQVPRYLSGLHAAIEAGSEEAAAMLLPELRTASDPLQVLREWAVDDVCTIMSDSPPEYFAFNVSEWREALPGHSEHWLDLYLARHLDKGDVKLPCSLPKQRQIYRNAFAQAMKAAIDACQQGCPDSGSYDADQVRDQAIDAAAATLTTG